MNFNSYLFIFLFLPIAWAGYFSLHGLAGYVGARGNGLAASRLHITARVWLLAMSMWFYGYFHPWYLLLITASICVNYLIYSMMARMSSNGALDRVRTLLLIVGLSFDLGLIFYYKYFAFVSGELARLLHTDWAVRNVLLPLGISFFTFQQVSFLIDAWKGETGEYSFIDYALFVSFFPQLVAGPIVLHSELIPQLTDPDRLRPDMTRMSRGIQLFTLGLAKKLLIADVLGSAVAYGYTWSMELTATEAMLVILSYSFQIYFDFSGYSDMAVGLGQLFNIDLPQNFRSPYRALSITDFWRRWHMTLTRFLTHYAYIPLGGNRRGRMRTYVNIMLVFLVSGIWHGAAWTFILWGLLHGIMQCIERAMGIGTPRYGEGTLTRVAGYIVVALRWAITFILVNLGWALFRAGSVSQWGELLTRLICGEYEVRTELLEFYRLPKVRYILALLRLPAGERPELIFSCVALLIVSLLLVLVPRNNYEREMGTGRAALMTTVLLFLVCVVSLGRVSTFLYFNF